MVSADVDEFVHRWQALRLCWVGLADRTKETIGLGQSPVTRAASSNQPLDGEKAFDSLGIRVIEEYGEWKPEDASMDARFQAMYQGHTRLVGGAELKNKIAYAFGAEFVEVRVNKFPAKSVCPVCSVPLPLAIL